MEAVLWLVKRVYFCDSNKRMTTKSALFSDNARLAQREITDTTFQNSIALSLSAINLVCSQIWLALRH